MVMMFAFASIAERMPCATSAVVPIPLLFRTCTGRIVEEGATPSLPKPFFCEAMTPATCVPWSMGVSFPAGVITMGARTELASSGWLVFMGLSSTAMTVLAPCEMVFAAGMLVDVRYHWFSKSGSCPGYEIPFVLGAESVCERVSPAGYMMS